eukprot:CFRG6681T1
MHKAYRCLIDNLNPDIVVVLGDTLDEGYTADDVSYEQYKNRFDNIFQQENVNLVVVAGDNDIGGEGSDVQNHQQVRRFEEWQGGVNQLRTVKGVDFVIVNTLALTATVRSSDTVRDTRKFVDEYKTRNSFSVLVTHPPLKMMEKQTREWLLRGTRPNFILSGHTHTTSEKKETYVDDEDASAVQRSVTEWTAPTFSYRMGTTMAGECLVLE